MTGFEFPPGFVWGTATASYQIEGAAGEDGRGPSIWDTFSRRPGAVLGGDTGDVACDHYHRWEADLDLVRSLNLTHYRFSIAWPRILPAGRGRVNRAGLDFYDRLTDGMLARGLVPFATLYHWDLPQALEDEGGWRVRATADAFAEYAREVVRVLGDRIGDWATFNELPCIVNLGHRTGEHAPGAKEPERTIRQVTHNLLLAHGRAVRAIREESPGARVGIVHNPDVPEPQTDAEADIAVGRKGFAEYNAWMLDPVFLGEYPADQWEGLGADVPEREPGDMEEIRQPLDFLGINAYSTRGFASAERGLDSPEEHYPRTDMGWPITNDVLYWACRFANERYSPPCIHITENGCAWPDAPEKLGGGVRDYARIAYLRHHLRGVHRAIGEGVPVRGYFAWSLMDNFEWAWGYSRRFGLVYVDYETQRRIPKYSAQWYASVARRNAL